MKRLAAPYNEYAVDEMGNVWSLRFGKTRKLTLSKAGERTHLQVSLCGNRFYVHRLVLGAFVGPCPQGMECRHLDGNPYNNRLDNLAWGTSKENKDDMVRHGTRSRNAAARLKTPTGKKRDPLSVKIGDILRRRHLVSWKPGRDNPYDRANVAELADRCGCAPNTMYNFFRGGTGPCGLSLALFTRVCAALDVLPSAVMLAAEKGIRK